MITCEYTEQAEKFLRDTKTEFKAEFAKYGKHFEDDTAERDIYTITLTRGNREYTFNFGQSVAGSHYYKDIKTKEEFYCDGSNKVFRKRGYTPDFLSKASYGLGYNGVKMIFKKGETPTAYDVLACLTKYDPCSFEDFCSDYGYDTDSKKAERIYNSVVNEWHNVAMLWNDEEIELLQEIN